MRKRGLIVAALAFLALLLVQGPRPTRRTPILPATHGRRSGHHDDRGRERRHRKDHHST